jgi:hypothetical protein
VRAFVRHYTAGLRGEDLRRLFDRDAARAFAVLTRDHDTDGTRPASFLKRLAVYTRLAFLGISYKLSPARRAVFAGALICAVLGIVDVRFAVSRHVTNVTVASSPGLFLLAFGGVVFLLAMEMVDRVVVRDELEVARELQRDLMPAQAPALSGYAFAHSWRTANEVGGDYYDFVPLADGRLALMMADASGHGMAAGLLMAGAHATLLAACEVDPDPRRAALLLHRLLRRSRDRRAFMTLFFALLDRASGRLDYVCAAHPFPLLRRASGEIVELGEGGFPLGVGDEPRLRPGSTVLAPGDVLVLYTDGMPEALGDDGATAFGFDRLRELLALGGTAAGVHDRLVGRFEAFRGQEPLQDDVSLVVVERVVLPPLPDLAPSPSPST